MADESNPVIPPPQNSPNMSFLVDWLWKSGPTVRDILDRKAGPEERRPAGFMRRFSSSILKQGPIPKHVALIMDGNRRYARKMNLSHVSDGHAMGFEKLAEVGGKPTFDPSSLLNAWPLDFGMVPRPRNQRGHSLRIEHREL